MPGIRTGVSSALVALGTVLVSGCGHESPIESPRPNIVLISLDTLRPDHLEVHGYHRATAPNLARLAAESVVFDNVYSQAPKTAPSHMTLFTGRFPGAHGVRNLRGDDGDRAVSADVPLMAELLRAAGYQTAGFTGGGHMGPTLGFARGFEGFEARGQSIHRARKWLEASSAVEPFFLFIHTYAIHDPYTPPKRFQIFNDPDYSGQIIGSRRELIRGGPGEWKERHEKYWDRVDPESDEDLARLRDLYDAGILATDSRLGKLFDHLAESGRLANTLVILLSDHGEEFREHGGFLHESLYEENLRALLVMRFPDRWEDAPRGSRVTPSVRLIDVLPTLLELLNLEAPADVQGVSLVPLIQAGHQGPLPVLLSEWPGEGERALRRGRWKLIVDAEGGEQLFDLESDPGETRNLLDEAPDRARALRTELGRLVAENRILLERAPPIEDLEMDAEVREQLEALGYLE